MTEIKVKIIIDDELEPLNEVSLFIISEFKQFKIDSFNQSTNNFITTNEGIQKNTPSIHSMFGRDYVFEQPKKWIAKILSENLSHAHVNTDNETEDNNNWNEEKAQWHCTSNESIVYSGFKIDEKKYCLVIHDLLINHGNTVGFDAHNSYEEEDIEYYIKNSIFHRKNETQKKD